MNELDAASAKAPAEDLDTAKKKAGDQRKKLDEAIKRLAQIQKEKKPGALQPRTRKMMAPQPLDRSPVETEPGQDPRLQLANWITDPQNRNFSSAMVNRLWKHFMGAGLVERLK